MTTFEDSEKESEYGYVRKVNVLIYYVYLQVQYAAIGSIFLCQSMLTYNLVEDED